MPELTERVLAATLLGDLEQSIADQLIDIHLRVVRDLFCPITGNVLDSRTAHLVYVRIGTSIGEPTIAGVVHPSASNDELIERLAQAGAELTGRFDPSDAWQTVR